MNSYSSTINNRLETIVNTPLKNNPLKNIGSNINNNVERFVNTPIKEISSKVSNGLYNNNYNTGTGSDYMPGSSSSSSLFKKVFFWIAIILVLAFLGFNIFAYLAYGTDIFTSLMAPFTYIIAYFTGETAKTTLKHTSQGTQAIVNESSNFLQIFLKFMTDLFNNTLVVVTTSSTSAIDYLQSNMKKDKTINVKPEKQIPEKQIPDSSGNIQETQEDNDDSTLLKEERKVEARVPNVSDSIKKSILQKERTEPEPLDSDTQQNGYCYIGKINNSRYCAKVSSNNSCMSGDIFPTMAVCINPNLKT
jgi:hypothetical protein|uniref:Uncharacterized protein n=1 Tax=viral metagenome TaxID=1070528 RepID=A0A6C0CB89_9ZZZZ